jgi:hypothetical protein
MPDQKTAVQQDQPAASYNSAQQIVGERLGRVVVETDAMQKEASDRQSFLQKMWRWIVRF